MDACPISISQLSCRKESTYFMILVLFSYMVWLLALDSIVGLFSAAIFTSLNGLQMVCWWRCCDRKQLR